MSCGYKKWVPTLRSLGTTALSILLLFFNANSLALVSLPHLHRSHTDLLHISLYFSILATNIDL